MKIERTVRRYGNISHKQLDSQHKIEGAGSRGSTDSSEPRRPWPGFARVETINSDNILS
jgi:hypothetical protein